MKTEYLRTFTNASSLALIERIVACLQAKPLTARQVGALAHITEKTAKRYLAHLSEPGPAQRVRLLAWRVTDANQVAAHYAAGAGKNATRPPPQTQLEWSRRYRANVRKDPDKLHDERKRRRIAHYGGKPDPAAAWMNNPTQ